MRAPKAFDRVSRRALPLQNAGTYIQRTADGRMYTDSSHPKDNRHVVTAHANAAHGKFGRDPHRRQQAIAKLHAGANPSYWRVVLANS